MLANSQSNLSLVILEPFNKMAMEVLENQISMFELNTDFSLYPIDYQGPGSLRFPKLPPLDVTSFDLAIPLQSFGSVKFRYSEKATKIWKNSPLCFDVSKKRGVFQILWPSHNIWTLHRQLFLPDPTISRAKPLVVINPCTSQWCFKTLATLTWRPCSRPISMTKKLRLMVVKVSLLRQGPLKIWTEHSPLSHFWNYNLKGDIGRTPETPFVILKI